MASNYTRSGETRPWRLLDTGTGTGSFNLALDDALFRLAKSGESPPTIRFYSWFPAALSVGYFQNWEREIDASACRERGIEVYRRITGGRAVLHRREVTYSVVTGDGTAFFGDGLWPAYRKIGHALSEGLQELGVKAEIAPRRSRGAEVPKGRHPSCFSSTAGAELTIDGRKVAGSAQKREGRAVLQHGSILLEGYNREFGLLLKKPCAGAHGERSRPFAGLGSDHLSDRKIVEALSQGFRRVWHEPIENGSLTEKETELARQVEKERYLQPAWNFRRPAGRQ